MKKLYLDIDGVLVSRGKATEGVAEFLKFATEHFDCYWLSTHCQGDAAPVFLYLAKYLPQEALPFAEKFQATRWGTLKTDAIDFGTPFYWLDDYLMEAEKAILAKQNALDSFIPINLHTDPKQILELAANNILSP